MLKYNWKFGHGLRFHHDVHDGTMVTMDPGITNRHRVHRVHRDIVVKPSTSDSRAYNA
jgi:hypothetical protein